MQSTPISSTALAVHDLGLAAAFGGTLFGKLGLNPAVQAVDSDQRRQVLHAAWGGYNWVNGASWAAVGASWLIGRMFMSGKEADSRGLTIAKDVLTTTLVGSGIAAFVGGRKLAAQTDDGQSTPVSEEAYQKTQRFVANAGTVNLVAAAGVIAVTALLNMRAGRSAKWSLFSNLLP